MLVQTREYDPSMSRPQLRAGQTEIEWSFEAQTGSSGRHERRQLASERQA